MQSSCLIKIIEIHLLDILMEKTCIDNKQFGFKKGVSTSDVCFILKEMMHDYSQNKGTGIALYVDLSKAFDNVDHFILGRKLLAKNIPVDLVLLLMHYFRNQYANVVWRGYHHHYRPVEKGVRQGGILSPFLFKLYIDSIITDVSIVEHGCMVGGTRVNVLAYADDIVLTARSVNDLEKLYSKLNSELQCHSLKINQTKTKCMIFNASRKVQINIVRCGEIDFEVVKSYKYLGHLISSDLQDGGDVQGHLNHFYAYFNSILRDFKYVDKETLIFLFNSYCKPDYGLSLWNHKNTLRSRIFNTYEVAYSNALKRMIGAPSYSSSHEAAETCGQLLLRHHLALVQARFYKKLQHSNCSLIKFNIPVFENGYSCTFIHNIFKEKYSISLTNNSLDVIMSRISWVQRHEERRTPVVGVR